MIQINSKADLNRAVANALHPEPPASERRAIHESGVWRWMPLAELYRDCKSCDRTGNFYRHDEDGDFLPCDDCAGEGQTTYELPPHWEPFDFCGDPVASYALRQKMRAAGWEWAGASGLLSTKMVRAEFYRSEKSSVSGKGYHANECTAFALAALRALGVEFVLVEGWDAR